MDGQLEYIFFNNSPPPPRETINAFLNPENKNSPYHGFIGNKNAINKLIRIDFDALRNYNHVCNKVSVAFIGQSGSGKTELARRHAGANGCPLVELSPKSIKSLQDIFAEMSRVCELSNIPLIQVERKNNYYLPPINVFIDEVHALSNYIIQGLLKATEPKDAFIVTEKNLRIDCENVHWVIATTDRGKLFDAFDTRFSKIQLNLYNKDEIAQIVKVNYQQWSMETCNLVAHYCSKIPREALVFAREMLMEWEMYPTLWETIAATVARDNEIDEFGMTYKRLNILKALGQGPIAEKRLPNIAGVKKEELEKFIMPWLLESTNDQLPYITVGNKGYEITETGIGELNKRGIPNKYHQLKLVDYFCAES